MIHVVAIITTAAGRRDQVLAAFRANVPAVLAERGCIEYQGVVDLDGAGPLQTPLGEHSFAVIEKWQSLADLQAHAASPHMAAYAERVRGWIVERRVHVLGAT